MYIMYGVLVVLAVMGEVMGSGTHGMDMRRLCIVGWLQSTGLYRQLSTILALYR
jgi:hypothetical protein